MQGCGLLLVVILALGALAQAVAWIQKNTTTFIVIAVPVAVILVGAFIYWLRSGTPQTPVPTSSRDPQPVRPASGVDDARAGGPSRVPPPTTGISRTATVPVAPRLSEPDIDPPHGRSAEQTRFIQAYGSDAHAMTSGVRDSGDYFDDPWDDDWTLDEEKPRRSATRPSKTHSVDCPACGDSMFSFTGDSETCDECKTEIVPSIDQRGALCFRTRADHEDRMTNAIVYGGIAVEDAHRLFVEVSRIPLRKWEFRSLAELGITETTFFSFVVGTCTACSERHGMTFPLREMVSVAPPGCVCRPCRCYYFPKFESRT